MISEVWTALNPPFSDFQLLSDEAYWGFSTAFTLLRLSGLSLCLHLKQRNLKLVFRLSWIEDVRRTWDKPDVLIPPLNGMKIHKIKKKNDYDLEMALNIYLKYIYPIKYSDLWASIKIKAPPLERP